MQGAENYFVQSYRLADALMREFYADLFETWLVPPCDFCQKIRIQNIVNQVKESNAWTFRFEKRFYFSKYANSR